MHRLLSRLLALFAAFSLALAGTPGWARQRLPTPVPNRLVPAETVAHPALWKVTRGATTIYLFGTVHALPQGITWYDGTVANAFEHSDELVTEIVESTPEEMQALVLARAVLPQGKSLRSMLKPKDRAALEGALKANAMPADAFDRFEPWYAAVALATLPLLKDGYGTENGVEVALDAKAKALGRPHGALETAAYQLGLFGSLPVEVQKHYLRDVIDNLPTLRRDLAAMIGEWSVGNAAKLAELMNQDADDPLLTKLLLTDRNKAWAQWLKARLDKPGTVFVAVGAGHLAGPGSVQEQLKLLGIAATRVQ
ncbi:MAG: TraB/GumN family protein [Novosphingobium sp.]|nr:TraB/GumN family protein [Novosphingobium sp.]